MNYKETCEYLYNQMPMFERQGASGYKEGLSNTLALDEHLGHPHLSFKSIHVGGTNGKGSVSHTIASVLQQCGYNVGLYTSPHLVDFRERIRVNGRPISQQYVVKFVEEQRSFFEPLHPSFFEVTTAMAFQYFKEKKVDIAIVEVGLGDDWTAPTSFSRWSALSPTSVSTTPNFWATHWQRLLGRRLVLLKKVRL